MSDKGLDISFISDKPEDDRVYKQYMNQFLDIMIMDSASRITRAQTLIKKIDQDNLLTDNLKSLLIDCFRQIIPEIFTTETFEKGMKLYELIEWNKFNIDSSDLIRKINKINNPQLRDMLWRLFLVRVNNSELSDDRKKYWEEVMLKYWVSETNYSN